MKCKQKREFCFALSHMHFTSFSFETNEHTCSDMKRNSNKIVDEKKNRIGIRQSAITFADKRGKKPSSANR